jgi:MFS transporter, PPP family, 3-phenylpropionic acid transporter
LALMAAYIPDVRTNAGEPAAGGARVAGELTTARALRQLFGNRAYVYILVVVFLMYLGVQTTFNFQGLLIKGTGGGVAELGWTYFVGVMSEMPAMFLSVWLLPRMPARRLMILSGCLYMLRYALIIYFQTPWIILLTASLEGLAFGLLLTSLRSQVFAVVAEEVQTLAMTIVDAVFLSLTVILGGAVGGWLIEHYSLVHMLAACMASSALSLALLFLGRRYDCPANSRTATLP